MSSALSRWRCSARSSPGCGISRSRRPPSFKRRRRRTRCGKSSTPRPEGGSSMRRAASSSTTRWPTCSPWIAPSPIVSGGTFCGSSRCCSVVRRSSCGPGSRIHGTPCTRRCGSPTISPTNNSSTCRNTGRSSRVCARRPFRFVSTSAVRRRSTFSGTSGRSTRTSSRRRSTRTPTNWATRSARAASS